MAEQFFSGQFFRGKWENRSEKWQNNFTGNFLIENEKSHLKIDIFFLGNISTENEEIAKN